MQLLAALLAWVFIAPATHLLAWALLQGVLAAGFALLNGAGRLSVMIHAALVPLLCALSLLGLPPWLYLLAFILTFSLSRNTLLERVPLYRSSREVTACLAQELAPNAHVLDAGSGDGRLALTLALERSDLEVTAMENAWGSHALAWLRWQLNGRPENFHPRCRSFWCEDWGGYDVVYVFLSPAPMHKVWGKFQQQGKAGGLLISNTFDIPGVQPERTLPLTGHLQQALLFWCRHHGTQ
jgi:hypothetical protein